MRAASDGTDGQDMLDSGGEARVGNDEGTGTKPRAGSWGTALSDSFQGGDSALRARLLNIWSMLRCAPHPSPVCAFRLQRSAIGVGIRVH